ncbi:carbohydrate ABC transporter permease [Candidatus Nomurabacteria bacterium]|nr:carbohydrate ABC transporter permease [Candidatus Nomurabacteria bacterium]
MKLSARSVIESLMNRDKDEIDYLKKIVGRKFKSKIWSLIRAVLLIGLSFVLLYPLLYTLTMSIRFSEDLMDPLSMWIPKRLTAVNFIDAYTTMKYPQAVFNSIKFGLVSSVFQVVSCSLVGYGFARFRFKGNNILFALVLFTLFVPPQLIIVPSYLQFRYFDIFGIGSLAGLFTGEKLTINLLDSVWTFYLPAMTGVGIRSGLFIFVFRQFFRGMPRELQESAYIDGCNQFKTYLKIMLPNAVPCIVTVALFSIVWYWNDFYYSAMYINQSKTVSLALSTLKIDYILVLQNFNFSNTDPYDLITRVQAGVFLTLSPVLLLYLFLQRYFVESIERTGIVG